MQLSPSSLAFYSDEHSSALQIEIDPAVRTPVLAQFPPGGLWEPPRAESLRPCPFWAPRTSVTHGNPNWEIEAAHTQARASSPSALWGFGGPNS